jgi:flagellar motor switch protein FliG
VQRLAEHTDPEELAEVIAQESTRCAAVIASLLPPEKSGEVLEELPPRRRKEVVDRSLQCEDVPPELARELAEGVLSRLQEKSSRSRGTGREERISRLAFMFGSLEDEERKEAMEQLREQEPDVAQEVQRKMFAFEDLEWVERRSLQDLLGRMEPSTLALAIKGASRDMEEVILENISTRMQEEVQEERELAGSVPLSKAEEAREKVMDEARRMSEDGELEFAGTQGDEYVE